jgi:uncharacterized protein YcfJ
MKHPRIVLTSLILASAMTFTSCESTTGTGALAGAGAGAILGSVLGHGKGSNILAGAAAGAAAGALAGHIIGHADDRGYYDGRHLPYGRMVDRGICESPYSPHNLVDVRGIPHGAVVEDPSTGGQFIKP